MTLKIHINGQSKRIITPLRTFINGTRVRLTKGFTFVNGEKVQLWGNTRTESFYIPWNLGWDNDNLYIDDSVYYSFGTRFINATSSDGQTVRISKENCLTQIDITNPSAATPVNYSEWGQKPVFSPTESDDETYIYYLASGSTRNKVQLKKNVGKSVVATYGVQSGLDWCVPLANGKNLWYRHETVVHTIRPFYSATTTVYFGYNGTTVETTSGSVITGSIATLSSVVWDGGDFVVGGTGTALGFGTISGTSYLTNNTYVTSKVVDGDYVFVAGYKSNATTVTKIAKYHVMNDTTAWEILFDDDRRPDIIGISNGKYYVVDKPKDFNATDTNVYLRIYSASDGTELEVAILDIRTVEDAKIIGWKVFPVRAKNGVLSMHYYNSYKMYICKIFVD